ncbi:unnamed protein product [Chondrus crispus]|uniref:Peptidase A1 domain-containing protein n=1 Tax=Chondrus crispus TaxID=2769 RepID=R7QR09_CHOCR|nr:unnamed protein product [Chondrus crispus]CDF40549.1 unnamed protein product [Chondrus crispus]|eukprot:XP_005710843.1 unnamed protein product [Chondrus crispus]
MLRIPSFLPTALLLLLFPCAHADLPSALLFPRPAARHHVYTKGQRKSIALSGGLFHTSGFFFNASVGGQPLRLNLDLSYSSLIIPRKGCVGCRVGDNLYDPALSPSATRVACDDARCAAHTDVCHNNMCFACSRSGSCCVEGAPDCAFNMLYGDGSSGNGTMYQDSLHVAGLDATISFGAMHQESHNFELPYADGVLGLAFQKAACHPTCIPPVMDALVNQTGIDNVFTLCVSRFGGTLVLGAADEGLARAAYHYLDLSPDADDTRFIVPAQSEWKVNDRSLSVPSITAAMLSTGSASIGVSKETLIALISHVREHFCHIDGICSMTSWFRPQSCSYIPDESLRQMPNITMGLSREVSITLQPEDYLIQYRVIKGKMHRCVAFIATEGLAQKGVGLLLGATVMRRYAVVFDRGQKRVGFAPANDEVCGPKTGSDSGLPAYKTGGNESILTADSPGVQGAVPVRNDTEVGKHLLQAERCRAEETCSGCASQSDCSFGYQTGLCVPLDEAGSIPYPYCKGSFCACIAVGPSGWYVGVAIGTLLATAIVSAIVFVFRKRQQNNRYQMVQSYEEQDLETF